MKNDQGESLKTVDMGYVDRESEEAVVDTDGQSVNLPVSTSDEITKQAPQNSIQASERQVQAMRTIGGGEKSQQLDQAEGLGGAGGLAVIPGHPRQGYRNFETPEADHSEISRNQLLDIGGPSSQEIASQFQGVRHSTIGGKPHFENIAVKNEYNYSNHGGTYGIAILKEFVSFQALHDSSAQDPTCRVHPGTRRRILKRIQDWIDTPSAKERIFWLHGPAGVGKSAIAQTVARACAREKLAATFFFYRSDPGRNDGNRLFTTLAWQFTHSIPATKNALIHTLIERPDIPMTDVETQFEELIVKPFLALKRSGVHLSAPVVIIDGVDECSDDSLQRRFLKTIGDAVKDDRIPLRFLICSRPEAHIQDTVDIFRSLTLPLDLATLDDANQDIEKYLRAEFSRIASEQGIDTAWPSEEIIQEVVYKASGQFVYATTVIRYVGDEYSSAETQLAILLGLKPPSSMSPFGELDELYKEILRRQRDPVFLTDFLSLLIGRHGTKRQNLHEDDAMLMNVSMKGLHRKLRGIRSLLRVEPFIDVHHRSFLDFLQDPSRSGQYYAGAQDAIRQYLKVIVDSLVRYVSTVIEQPDHHKSHFTPMFGQLIRRNPEAIGLDVEAWEETLHLLLHLMDKLMVLPIIDSLKTGYCQKCRFFHIIYDILTHLKSLREREDPDVEKYLEFLEEIINSDNKSHMATAGVAAENIPDESYLEILNRVPDQNLLKTFLGLLVGRSSISSGDSLSKDDAMLLDISRDELGERLHEMGSILRFEPFIDVHHRSFLDFLQNSPQSGQYHVNRSAGTRRYLELVTKLLIRHARLTNHGDNHFAPEFGKLIKRNPQAIEWDVEDWEQTLRPLLNALAKLLIPSNINSLMDGYCQQCRFFQITYDTLTHFKSLRQREDPVVERCLKSLEEIILYGNPGHQNFETNFRPVVFGSAAIGGILMAILAHQR